MIIVSTPWENRPLSEATAQHLGLGDDNVWVRTAEGIPYFFVLPAGLEPDMWTPGYLDIHTALRLRGR